MGSLENLNDRETRAGGIADYNRLFFPLLQSCWPEGDAGASWAYACLGASTRTTFWRAFGRRRYGQKLAVTMHDGPLLDSCPFTGIGLPSTVERALNHTAGRAANRRLLRRVDLLFALTRAGARAVRPFLRSEARLIHLPHFAFVNRAVRARTVDEAFRRVYFIGGVRRDKRFDLFMHFCGRLAARGFDVLPTIVGRIADPDYYTRTLEASGWRAELHQHSPHELSGFSDALAAPGIAFFCHARRTVSASAAQMHALGSGLPVLCPAGSPMEEYLIPGSGSVYRTLDEAVELAAAIFEQPPAVEARLAMIGAVEARYGFSAVGERLAKALRAAPDTRWQAIHG
ncbi:MAG: hypothetical protein JXB36_03330 [Gammaproteobacteria bacterium]|nr:hypothetical protein [Gammaproteobacteria bacterium]